jgi:transposase-like protein
MGRVSQAVLPLLPAEARSIGPSAGLLEGPDGGLVFIFGLATFSYGAGDEVGRRLAAVQLVATRVATSQEVAAAFSVSGVTLWTWRRDFAAGGVLALVRARTGPKGPIKLTAALAGRIARLDAAGETLLKIAARTGVSTATVRVALGRVTPRSQAPVEPDDDVDEPKDGAEVADLVVLAPPLPRTTDRVAARFGDLVEAPVVITQGAQLPLAGLLLALPALEMTGLLPVAAEVFPPMRKGFYGLRATLLMGVFLALLREPRAEAATRIRPADLGRLLGLDRAPEVKTLRSQAMPSRLAST